jgi:hypothetical protein
MQLFRDVKRDIEDELRSNAVAAIKRELPSSSEMKHLRRKWIGYSQGRGRVAVSA